MPLGAQLSLAERTVRVTPYFGHYPLVAANKHSASSRRASIAGGLEPPLSVYAGGVPVFAILFSHSCLPDKADVLQSSNRLSRKSKLLRAVCISANPCFSKPAPQPRRITHCSTIFLLQPSDSAALQPSKRCQPRRAQGIIRLPTPDRARDRPRHGNRAAVALVARAKPASHSTAATTICPNGSVTQDMSRTCLATTTCCISAVPSSNQKPRASR